MKTNVMKPLLRPAGRALRRLSLVAGLGAGLLLSGCIDSNSECVEDQPGYEEGKNVWLSVNFRNVDSEGRSRALTDADHPDEDATAAENFIDVNDITVMFLNSDGRVMKVFADGEDSVEVNSNTDGLYNDYVLRFRINQDYFEKTGATSTFSLLVVANHDGTGDGQRYNPDNLWMKSVADLSALKTSFGYTGQNGTAAWTPDIAGGRHIPMAGIHRFTVSRAALESATDANNPLVITDGGNEIDMQRAMAKIRVIDALAENGNTDNEITAVTLSGMNRRGAYLPLVPFNEWGTQVVPNTSVCHIAHGDASWFNPSTVIPSYTIGADGWGFYIPEFSWTLAPAAAEPTLHITVHSASTGLDRIYDYPVSKALGASDMTRNHIYEFRVTEIAGTEAELTLVVKDWDDQEVIWDYTDNPGLATGGWIVFDRNTCAVVDDLAQAVFRNDKADIKAQFTLAEPVNATWRAVFIYEKGKQGAFRFVDKDGNEVETISGEIDGTTPASLIIRTKDTTREDNNVARLQIIVTMADGRTVTANVLTGGNYGKNTYFTIIQNCQL